MTIGAQFNEELDTEVLPTDLGGRGDSLGGVIRVSKKRVRRALHLTRSTGRGRYSQAPAAVGEWGANGKQTGETGGAQGGQLWSKKKVENQKGAKVQHTKGKSVGMVKKG